MFWPDHAFTRILIILILANIEVYFPAWICYTKHDIAPIYAHKRITHHDHNSPEFTWSIVKKAQARNQ